MVINSMLCLKDKYQYSYPGRKTKHWNLMGIKIKPLIKFMKVEKIIQAFNQYNREERQP